MSIVPWLILIALLLAFVASFWALAGWPEDLLGWFLFLVAPVLFGCGVMLLSSSWREPPYLQLNHADRLIDLYGAARST